MEGGFEISQRTRETHDNPEQTMELKDEKETGERTGDKTETSAESVFEPREPKVILHFLHF